MMRVFPSPAGRGAFRWRGTGRALLPALLALAACDQNMSDTPLPDATPEERAALAARLSQAPELSVPAGRTVSGFVLVAPRVQPLTSPEDVLFVIARAPGDDGPPAAVERLTGNAYPMPFVLETPAGEPRPLQLLVKVDKDGDAGTTVPQDLLGFAPAVTAGDADVRVLVESTFAELQAALADSAEAPEGPPTPGGAAPPAAVEGVLDLREGLSGRTRPDDVIFVMARDASRPGPPVAVLRLTGDRYPVRFRLDDATRMLGRPWPERVTVEARRDADGDPLTRGPEDLAGAADGAVRPGSGDEVRIVLDEVP